MTVTHVVLLRWATADPEIRESVSAQVVALPGQIAAIQALAEGPSISLEGLESGFEWGFVMTFATRADRDGYLSHPSHLPVSKAIAEAAARILVFDI